MYIHIGEGVMLRQDEILGIFDMDNASWAYKTREFLERAELEGRVVWSCDDLPVSFLLVEWEDKQIPKASASRGKAAPLLTPLGTTS